MFTNAFDAFRAELRSLQGALGGVPTRTVRDEDLRERFRTVFRAWASSVSPTIRPFLSTRKEFAKLTAEMQALASLTTRMKAVAEYRKRLNRAITLVNSLVLFLPSEKVGAPAHSGMTRRQDLFLPNIPDLPIELVPNAVLGWKAHMEAFQVSHPFDKSIFVMIRYRKRNAALIAGIKQACEENRFHAVLASEHNLTDDLYNPIACLLCCSRGLAVFDQAEAGQTFNPNVAYELGFMHMLGREARILKHKSLAVLHTDILMKLYREYGSASDAKFLVKDWLGNGA